MRRVRSDKNWIKTVSLEIAKQLSTPTNGTAPPDRKPDKVYYIMKLPYTNEGALRRVKKAVKESGLPIRVVTASGKTVKSMVKTHYNNKENSPNCECELHKHGIPCSEENVVYHASCNLCNNSTYIGVSSRPLKTRINEHETHTRLGHVDLSAVAEHANEMHLELLHGQAGKREYETFFNIFKFDIINKGKDPIDAYLRESRAITRLRPPLNKMCNNGFIF